MNSKKNLLRQAFLTTMNNLIYRMECFRRVISDGDNFWYEFPPVPKFNLKIKLELASGAYIKNNYLTKAHTSNYNLSTKTSSLLLKEDEFISSDSASLVGNFALEFVICFSVVRERVKFDSVFCAPHLKQCLLSTIFLIS